MINLHSNLNKEVCGCCSKTIKFGQAITECGKCETAIHTRCFKKSNFGYANNIFYCKTCLIDVETRYNPFYHDTNSNFYDGELCDIIESMQSTSSLLENCKQYTVDNMNNLLSENFPIPNNLFSSLFLNIDGNYSNFDSLVVELERYDHKYSVIGLAETNTDPSNKNLYHLDYYNSFYQQPYPD